MDQNGSNCSACSDISLESIGISPLKRLVLVPRVRNILYRPVGRPDNHAQSKKKIPGRIKLPLKWHSSLLFTSFNT
jgi:hypothetical protein